MNKKINVKVRHFHRSQIGRAQRFIRSHLVEDLNLKQIAKEAGSSEYHFGRLFLAYTGETTYSYLRRLRLSTSLRLLQEDTQGSITEIALNVGYETPSAFNKAFKAILKMSPSQFRHLGKAQQDELIYIHSTTQKEKEMTMNLNLNPKFITRPTHHLLYVEKHGSFKEVAMPTWYELIPLVKKYVPENIITEYLGLSHMDMSTNDDSKMSYFAGVCIKELPTKIPKGLKSKKIPSGSYASFTLIGATHQVWAAFDQIFQYLADHKIRLRSGDCIENYLSNPEVVPENELVTELLVPIEA